MGDFYQNGIVTTLHDFRLPSQVIEDRLNQLAKRRAMNLILPCTGSCLNSPALNNILDELAQISFLDRIVVGLESASAEQFKQAKLYFAHLPQNHKIIWNDGPGLQSVYQKLHALKLTSTRPGKGRNVWTCFGYVIAAGDCEAVAVHDCDIMTYHRSMLAKLIYPVVEPQFAFRFCKGFYLRASAEKMHGRVTRLLVAPLVQTLKRFCCCCEFLTYFESFRYPLAGEFSMRADVIKTIRVSRDAGFEVGILAEARRINALNRICQVEIADRYDHKHQMCSLSNERIGLGKISLDICSTLFGKLAANGIKFTTEMIRSIKATYYRIAQDHIEKYSADAAINGLPYNYDDEENLIDLFARTIYTAGTEFLNSRQQSSQMPSWRRVMSADPHVIGELYNVIENDNDR